MAASAQRTARLLERPRRWGSPARHGLRPTTIKSNTGNSNASHLHFQIMNGASALGSNGVPYVISNFNYHGRVPLNVYEAADNYLTGNFGRQRVPTPQPRTNELPLNLAIINFPN